MTRRRQNRTGRGFRNLVRAVTVLYILGLLTLLGLVYGPGEGFWPVTLFLFGPRWVVALPLLPLGVLCLLVDRRLLALVVLATLGLARPLFGFNVPWRSLGWSADHTDGQTLRLVTWNVGTVRRRADIRRLLEAEGPDIVLLQECRRRDMRRWDDWHRDYEHSMCLLSRFPILEVASRDLSGVFARADSGVIVRYALDTPLGRVDLTHLHLETPREGLEALLRSGPGGIDTLKATNQQREIEARLARAWANEATGPLTLVAGDFNTPVESPIFHQRWRAYRDCHAEAGWGFGFTKWTRRIGVRIDHALAGPGFQCLESRVVSGMDGDHSPLVVLVRARPASS